MITMKTAASAAALTLLMGTGALVATTAPAAARIVCNSYGDCWHVDRGYHYGRDVRARYYNDDWYFHQQWTNNERYHYRDPHEGRGYYKGGVWITF